MNVLFDLDGTLTDPRIGFVRSIGSALARLGSPVPNDDALAKFIGPPLESSLRQLLGSNADSLVVRAAEYYRERYSTEGFLENYVYPGVEDALGEFHSTGVPLFVATSKPHPIAIRILDHFGLSKFFAGIYGSELDGTRSDKSELLRYLIARECLDASHTVMVGDRMHDIRAARANDLRSVGVLWGYGSRDELRDAGAHCLCESPGQITSILLGSTQRADCLSQLGSALN
jgi:phosphoglycolate phosphatase